MRRSERSKAEVASQPRPAVHRRRLLQRDISFLGNAFSGMSARPIQRPEMCGHRDLLPPRTHTFSELHRVASDEIFHFYLGDPVEMLQLWPDGSGKQVLIGTDIKSGMAPQVVVPHGVWQGARLVPGGEFALLSCTVSPGFEYADYESGSRQFLRWAYPEHRDMI